MSQLPPDWKSDRLKDVSAINAVSLPADTDPDYEFDYLEISNVDYHGIVDPKAIERMRYEMHHHEHGGACQRTARWFPQSGPTCRPWLSWKMGGRILSAPLGWKKVKMFRICQKISSGGTPSTFNLDYYGGNIPWVQTGDLNDGYVEVTEKTITQLGLEESAARIYPEGTLLIAMYGATIGKLGILKNPSATNQACCAMKFRNDVDNRYIFYLLRDFRPTLIAMSYGGGQPNISQETIKQLYFFLPPFHEQLKISQHLDNKTSAIETIKAGIEAQISTLTAYRKSLIHECVTGQRRVTEADVARAHRGREAK